MQDPQPRLLISGCARVFLQDPDPIQLCNELPPSDTPAQLSFHPPAQTQIAYLKDIRIAFSSTTTMTQQKGNTNCCWSNNVR